MENSERTATLQPAALGERSVTLGMDHQQAVDHVGAVFREVGFSLPTQFSPSERINTAQDEEIAPYTVIGLGIPAAGDHAFDVAGPEVGALFPCSVVVWQNDPGTQVVYHLSVMRLAREIGLAPDDDRWGALVAQVDKMIDDAFADLGRGVAGRHRGIDG